MKRSFKNCLALSLASKLSARGRELRRELRDHYRQEFARIRLAEKRARGLRLYVAWSFRPQREVVIAAVPSEAGYTRYWRHVAESAA